MSLAFMPERTRISVERYQKMVAAGIFTDRDRIELIDGEMINLSPIGSNHAALSAQLTKLLVMAVGDTAIVFVGGPVNLGNYSEPRELLAELHAELIEGIDAPDRALHEHAVLVQRQDAAQVRAVVCGYSSSELGRLPSWTLCAAPRDLRPLGAGLAHVRLDLLERVAEGEGLRLRQAVLQRQILALGAAPRAAQRRDEIERAVGVPWCSI
jgi:hypothetical protein